MSARDVFECRKVDCRKPRVISLMPGSCMKTR